MRTLEQIQVILDAFDASKVAAATGLHRATIRRIQNGGSCSLATLQKLNDYLDAWKRRQD